MMMHSLQLLTELSSTGGPSHPAEWRTHVVVSLGMEDVHVVWTAQTPQIGRELGPWVKMLAKFITGLTPLMIHSFSRLPSAIPPSRPHERSLEGATTCREVLGMMSSRTGTRLRCMRNTNRTRSRAHYVKFSHRENHPTTSRPPLIILQGGHMPRYSIVCRCGTACKNMRGSPASHSCRWQWATSIVRPPCPQRSRRSRVMLLLFVHCVTHQSRLLADTSKHAHAPSDCTSDIPILDANGISKKKATHQCMQWTPCKALGTSSRPGR